MPTIEGASRLKKTKWRDTLIFVAISSILYGVCGNFVTDFVKGVYADSVYPLIHRSDINLAKEGYRALVDADNANAAGDREKAVREYKHAIEKLTLASEAKIPRAMALLHRLYCVGREGFVEKNIPKGTQLGADAAALGDKYAKNNCAM